MRELLFIALVVFGPVAVFAGFVLLWKTPLRCPNCRRWFGPQVSGHDETLTVMGTREHESSRSDHWRYTCRHCGHVGHTSHVYYRSPRDG